MPWSINFSMTLHTEYFSSVTSDFLKQMIIFKSFFIIPCFKTDLFDNTISFIHFPKY